MHFVNSFFLLIQFLKMDIIYLFLCVEIRTLEDLKRNDGKNVIKSKIGCRLLFAEMFLTLTQYEALNHACRALPLHAVNFLPGDFMFADAV